MSSITGEIGYKVEASGNTRHLVGPHTVDGTLSVNGTLTVAGVLNVRGTSSLQGVVSVTPVNLDATLLSVINTAGTGTVFAVQISASGTATKSQGLRITAGVNAVADVPLLIMDAAGTSTFLKLTGDGAGTLGFFGTQNLPAMTWDNVGAVILQCGTGGQALTVKGAASANAMQVNGKSSGAAGGLIVWGGNGAGDLGFSAGNGGQSVRYLAVFGDGHGYISYDSGSNGMLWGTGMDLTIVVNSTSTPLRVKSGSIQQLQVSNIDGVTVLGTGSAYAWGTGTHYPALQFSGIGAMFGTGTIGVVITGGGLYFNGTNYIYGQAGTGVIETLGTGSYTVSCVSTAGSAGGTATLTTVFSIGGTVTSNKIQGYGPSAAALVDMTPDRVTAIATLAQGAANLNSTATICRSGNIVTCLIPAVIGTASGGVTTSVITVPMPASFQNTGTLGFFAEVGGNGTVAVGGVNYSGTTFTLFPTHFSGTFTGTLNRGLSQNTCFCWNTT